MGNGGDGVALPYCEKPAVVGGFDGGDGGNGGNTAVRVDKNASIPTDPCHKKKHVVENGGNGRDGRCSGKNGDNPTTNPFRGITTCDKELGKATRDPRNDGDSPTTVKGGSGGRGNRYPVIVIC